MEHETIYKGKVKIQKRPVSIVIKAGLDPAGTARFYFRVDQQEPLEIVLNPFTHQWEDLKDGHTEFSQVCGEIIESHYS